MMSSCFTTVLLPAAVIIAHVFILLYSSVVPGGTSGCLATHSLSSVARDWGHGLDLAADICDGRRTTDDGRRRCVLHACGHRCGGADGVALPPRRFSLNSAPCWCWRVLLAPAILEMDSTEPRSQKNTANRDGASSRISARLATFCLRDPPDSHIQPRQRRRRTWVGATPRGRRACSRPPARRRCRRYRQPPPAAAATAAAASAPLQGAFRLYTWAHRSRVPLRCMRQICVATDAAAA